MRDYFMFRPNTEPSFDDYLYAGFALLFAPIGVPLFLMGKLVHLLFRIAR